MFLVSMLSLFRMKRGDKKDEEANVNPYANLDKTSVLQEVSLILCIFRFFTPFRRKVNDSVFQKTY